MIAFAGTLGQLYDEIGRYIEAWGRNAPVGCAYAIPEAREMTGLDGQKWMAEPGEYLDQMQIEWVYVDPNGRIVGDEANDYRPKEGEVRAVKLS